MASFFAGSSNVTIVGGDFNDVKGNLTIFDHSRHTTNLGSNNTYTNNILNAYNDNSTTISGRVPRDGDEEDDQIPSRRSRSADHQEDDTPPPPPKNPFDPQQIASTGGAVTNLNSHNVTNTNVNHAFNNNSQNYYQGRAPPNTKGHNGPQWMSGPDQSTSGQNENGQFKAPVPLQAALPQQVWNGGRSGPHMSVDSACIQKMDPNMQRNLEKLMKFTLSQSQTIAAGNGGANYNPEVAYSSPPNVEGNGSMTTGMANLSIDDPPPSSKTSTSPSPQISTYLSPPPTFSRTKSDPQIGMKITSPDQMGSSNAFTGNLSPYSNDVQQASRSNPSLAPHMNEPDMVKFLSIPPTETQQYGNNSNRPPPASTSPFNFPPSSSGGPNFNTYRENVTKHDHRVYQTNIDAFNQYNNTIKDAFNDNSYTKHTGTPPAAESNKKRGFPEADAPRKKKNGKETTPDPRVDENDDQIPTAAESAAGSSGKPKGTKNWFSRRK